SDGPRPLSFEARFYRAVPSVKPCRAGICPEFRDGIGSRYGRVRGPVGQPAEQPGQDLEERPGDVANALGQIVVGGAVVVMTHHGAPPLSRWRPGSPFGCTPP